MATIPSLALIPSGYKASKVYSVLPTNGTGDFTFTRSGNATRVNSEGLIELVSTNVPRLNYPLIDGVVQGCPSLLLEPERINLVTYSEQFDNAAWTNLDDASVVANAEVAPDGTMSADKLVENTATAQHRIYRSISGTSNTFSIFAKADNRNYIGILANTGTRTYFNLSNGTIGAVSSGSTANIQYYGNGWYRCTLYNCHPTFGAMIQLSDNGTNDSYLGDGTSGVYIWGAQLEAGTYSTSYIPTTTTIGTRSAETCNNAGDVNTFNDSEGVLFAEISALANDLTNRYIAISDGTTSNRIIFRYFDGLSNSVSLFVVFGGVTQAEINYQTEDIKDTSKFAIKYKVNDFSLWVNGFEVGVDTSGSVPTGLSTLSFSNAGGTLPFYGNTKQIQYFDSALNDSDLETLTSWDSFSDMATSQLYTIE
jgi:hypothetical protein